MNMCPYPWQCINIEYTGMVRPCCFIKNGERFGNINNSSFEEIWNGDAMQQLRAAWRDGDLVAAGCDECRKLIYDPVYHYLDFLFEDSAYPEPVLNNYIKNKEEYTLKETLLQSYPISVTYSEDTRCNIDCIMCYQHTIKNLKLDPAISRNTFASLGKYALNIDWGGGEGLLQPSFIEHMKNRSEGFCFSNSFITNGTLLTKETVDFLASFPFCSVNISLDASSEATYKQIRRGGCLETVHNNIKYFLEKRKEHKRFWITTSFLWQKLNFTEVVDFLRWSKEFLVPTVIQPLIQFPVPLRIDIFHNMPEETFGYEKIKKEALLAAEALDESTKGIKRFFTKSPRPSLPSLRRCLGIIDEGMAKWAVYSWRDCSLFSYEETAPQRYLVALKGSEAISYAPVPRSGKLRIKVPENEKVTYEVWKDIYGDSRVLLPESAL